MRLARTDATPTANIAWMCSLIDHFADDPEPVRPGMVLYGLCVLAARDDTGHVETDDVRDLGNLVGPIFGVQIFPPDQEAS